MAKHPYFFCTELSRDAKPHASPPSARCQASSRDATGKFRTFLGDSLISDVDRAVIMVHRTLGRKFHLLNGE